MTGIGSSSSSSRTAAGEAADSSPGGSVQIGGRKARALLATIVDNGGCVRATLLPGRRITTVSRTGVGLSPHCNAMDFEDELNPCETVPGPSGDMRLIPDLAAALLLDRQTALAWAPCGQYDQELQPLGICQRETLKRAVASAAACGYSYLMSYEIEFTVHDGDSPGHTARWHSARAVVALEPYIIDLLMALESAEVPVEQIHGEFEPGQLEVSVGPTDPLAAADRAVFVRLAIQRVAREHGLQVTFSPVTAFGRLGNGCHVHLSLYRDNSNLLTGGQGPYGLTEVGEAALAGMLANLPAMLPVLAPSPVSYQRLQPGNYAGAYSCWGLENREAALRFIQASAGIRDKAANCEIKTVDNTANPYLAAAVLVAASQDGIARSRTLPPPTTADPHALAETERRRCAIERLPVSLKDAIAAMEQSGLVRATLGDSLFDTYLAARRGDLASAEALPERDLVLRLQDRYC